MISTWIDVNVDDRPDSSLGESRRLGGGGSLVAFALPHVLGQKSAAFAYAFALTLFVFGRGAYFSMAAFAMGGAFSAYFSGALRARIQQTVPVDANPTYVWAYANQVTQLINLIAYAGVGLLLESLGFYAFGTVLVGAALVTSIGLLLRPQP